MAKAAEQVPRDAEIRAAHAAGASVVTLVDRFGLSKSRIKQIVTAAPPATQPAGGAVRLAEERRQDIIDVLAEAKAFAALIPETQPAARVGAYRLLLDGLERLTSLEQKLGYLPTDMAELGHKRKFAEEIAAIFVEHDLPPEVRKAVLEVLDAAEGVS